MKHIENVVIGKPIYEPHWELLAKDEDDWLNNEKDKTYYTNERYLPRILVELGIFPSIGEIKRNKPELVRTLDQLDCIELRPTKKTYLYIIVGQDE